MKNISTLLFLVTGHFPINFTQNISVTNALYTQTTFSNIRSSKVQRKPWLHVISQLTSLKHTCLKSQGQKKYQWLVQSLCFLLQSTREKLQLLKRYEVSLQVLLDVAPVGKVSWHKKSRNNICVYEFRGKQNKIYRLFFLIIPHSSVSVT